MPREKEDAKPSVPRSLQRQQSGWMLSVFVRSWWWCRRPAHLRQQGWMWAAGHAMKTTTRSCASELPF
eukprot:1831-Eustigmatos_ZCMA.PRE.1